MIMVVAVTRKGVTRNTSELPIEEGWFRGRKGRGGSGEDDLHAGNEGAAEFLTDEIFQGKYQMTKGEFRRMVGALSHSCTQKDYS